MRLIAKNRLAGAGASVLVLRMGGKLRANEPDHESVFQRAGKPLAAFRWAQGVPGLGRALAAAACFLAVACGAGAGPDTGGGAVQVVTTTALLADLVKNVGGERVQVHSIVPPGADVHSFQTTPADSIAISRARVIVSNGFGLDTFLEPVLESAKGAGVIHVIAAEGLEPESDYRSNDQPPADGRAGGENRGLQGDPHLWQNPLFAIHYIEGIRDGLASADPDHAPDYRANAGKYIGELRRLDREISDILSAVAPDRRHLVTFHDAFSHFARRYGWKASALVATEAGEVSPAAVVRVLERVGNDMLPAVFVEPQFRSDVIQRAAEDAGVAVGTIHSGVSDAGVTSYVEMMRSNARSLAEHLR